MVQYVPVLHEDVNVLSSALLGREVLTSYLPLQIT